MVNVDSQVGAVQNEQPERCRDDETLPGLFVELYSGPPIWFGVDQLQ